MRTFAFAVALFISTAALAADEESKGSCAFGLSEYGVDVKTNCSIRWADPTGTVYYFGNEQVLVKLL